MSQLAIQDEREAPSILQSIAKAAADPSFDADKLVKLYELNQRDMAWKAKIAFNRDFAAASEEMPRVKKNGVQDMGTKGKITFAKYEDLDEAIRPVEKKYGFVRSFRSRPVTGGIVEILCMKHRDGHEEESEMQLPPDATGSGAMSGLKAMGSARSYGKRYLTKDYWNIITSEDKDDDGLRAGAIHQEQVDQLLTLCTQLGWTTPETRKPFLVWLKVAKIQEIQTYDYDKAEKELMRRLKGEK